MCKAVHPANQISPQYVKIVKDATCGRRNYISEVKFYRYLTISLNYIGFKLLFDPCCGGEGDSSFELQASTQFLNSTSHILLSAFILRQVCFFWTQLLRQLCKSVCFAIEMPEKEKIKKYKDMTKHEIRKNIFNCFIMLPPLNSQLRFQMV